MCSKRCALISAAVAAADAKPTLTPPLCTGGFFKNLIEDVGEELSPFFDKEVKKRGAEMLFWDVSYKEAKYLAKYHR